MEKIRIRVTSKDIELGVQSKSDSCPIARAIKRKKLGTKIAVGIGDIYIDAKIKKVSNPERVFRFVNDFDFGSPVEPFSFTLTL